MSRISVYIDVDDVISEIETEDLKEELRDRGEHIDGPEPIEISDHILKINSLEDEYKWKLISKYIERNFKGMTIKEVEEKFGENK